MMKPTKLISFIWSLDVLSVEHVSGRVVTRLQEGKAYAGRKVTTSYPTQSGKLAMAHMGPDHHKCE